MQSPQISQRVLFSAVSALSAFLLLTACGKRGSPLPPLVNLPAPPADLTAERRGNTIDLQFTIPGTNTDGTRPANVARVDVYAITGPLTPIPLTDDQVLKLGTKVASLPVKAPRDPNLTAEPDDPDEVEPPEGQGLDQGALVHVAEGLTRPMLMPVELPPDPRRPKAIAAAADRPLLGPMADVLSRTYVGLGVSTRGRRGPLSKPITVPLAPPPPPPSSLTMSYDESAVTLTWAFATPSPSSLPAGEAAVLPSTPIGVTRPAIAYNVYDVSATEAVAGAGVVSDTAVASGGGVASSRTAPGVKLTKAPIAEARFSDPRIVWGETRCYVVRTAETIGGMTIESDASPARCKTLTDTFPPAAPKGLQAVGSEGAINLIWEPNAEKDLAGYVLLRALAPGGSLEVITPAPFPEPMFKDAVRPGTRFVYAVKAVDKAGNLSPLSNRIEETAR